MKFRPLSILVLLIGASVPGLAQSPTPTPAASYSTFVQAMAAGKQAREAKKYPEQENAYRQALEKAKTVDQKFDAMMGLALVVSERSRMLDKPLRRDNQTIYSVARSDESFDIYQEILNLPGLSAAKVLSARLARADMLRIAHLVPYTPTELAAKRATITRKAAPDFVRDEYGQILKDPAASPDIKIGAHTGIARSYYRFPSNLNIARDGAAAVRALTAALKIAGGSNAFKSEALSDLVEIGQRTNNFGEMADGYRAILALKIADPKQRLVAARGLGRILISNKQPAEARTILQNELKAPGLTVDQKGLLHGLAAISYLDGVDPNNSSQIESGTKLARAELMRSIAYPKMTDDEKATVLIGHGEAFMLVPVGLAISVEMLEAVLKLKKPAPKFIARANYTLGEVYRANRKIDQARAAFESVSQQDDTRYYNFAQQRLKELSGGASRAN